MDPATLSSFYGQWQTKEWKPQAAANGRVPRNERGNVEVPPFTAALPEGTVSEPAGAAAAVFGPDAVSASVSEERGGPGVCVRLSLEEAVFLVHVLGTLRVVVEQKQQQR